MRHTIALAVAMALVAGCTMGPDYSRPEVQTPPSYRYADLPAPGSVDAAWWTQFGDPTLEALIAEALAHNKDIQIAAANVELSAASLEKTRSPLFPQVNYGANAGRYRFATGSIGGPSGGVSNQINAYNVLAGASWEIDLWGRVRRQTEAARASMFASDAARRGVVLTVVTQVATSYVQLRGLDEQLAIANRTLGVYAESLRITQDKYRYGQVSAMNVAQVQSQVETAKAEIPKIKEQIALTETALGILIGRNPGAIERGRPLLGLQAPAVPAGLPSSLLDARPDIMEAEERLIAANAQIGAAEALYFPSLSLTGTLGTASSELSNLFTGPAQTWNFVGAIAGPIFQGGAIEGEVAAAEAQHKALLVDYQRVIQNAFADVDQTLTSRRDLIERQGAQERLVASLQEYARLARLQYDGGYAPYSTVLQAEQQLFPEELKLAATRAQALAATVDIYRAMGGGWVAQADAKAPQPQPGGGLLSPDLPSGPGPSTAGPS